MVVEEAAEPLVSNLGGSLPYEEGLIIIFTGPKGAGKTANLSRWAMLAMSCWGKTVYSNIPMGGKIMGVDYEVQPLPDNFFVTYGRDVEPRSVVIVTELGEYFNNQDWQQLQSKMGVSMFAQIRKLNLYIFGDTQFFHHLNPRLAEQVDLLVRCKDLSKEPWGIEHKLGRGVEGLCDWYDLSGSISPNGRSARSEFQPNVISGDAYKHEVVYLEAFWKYYDSHKLVALEQRFKKFYIEKEKVRVLRPGEEALNTTTQKQQLLKFIKDAFNDAAGVGKELLKAESLHAMLYADGFDINQSQLGIETKKLGIERKYFSHHPEGAGTYYFVKEFSSHLDDAAGDL